MLVGVLLCAFFPRRGAQDWAARLLVLSPNPQTSEFQARRLKELTCRSSGLAKLQATASLRGFLLEDSRVRALSSAEVCQLLLGGRERGSERAGGSGGLIHRKTRTCHNIQGTRGPKQAALAVSDVVLSLLLRVNNIICFVWQPSAYPLGAWLISLSYCGLQFGRQSRASDGWGYYHSCGAPQCSARGFGVVKK